MTSLLTVPRDLVARRIGTQQLRLCVPCNHPLARGPAARLARIADLALLMREPGSMTRTLVEQACARNRIGLRAVTVIPTREAVKEAVAAGLGCGLVLSRGFGDDPRLTAVALADVPDPKGVNLICHAEAADLPSVRRRALAETAGP